jgi:hypothetical protein
MNGSEVGDLMSKEARAALDEDKTKDQLLLKINAFDVAFHNIEAAQMGKTVVGDRFSFVPFPCGAFIDLLYEAFFVLDQDRTKKFLDVGCGMGTKVVLACSLFDAYGIECEKEYVDKANLLGLNRVGHVDAFLFDKYDIFDVIYYYRPIHDYDKYRMFEQKIHKEAKSGAIIAPMHTDYEWDKCEDVERLTRFLYRKK